MNPLTNIKNLNKINQRELDMGVAGTGKSWHNEYRDSAWIFVGGLPYELTEGDMLSVFSQYGEIVHVNLIRDHATGKSKGFGFLCYEDQRSTILAVDNLNGMKVCKRTIRVDHVQTYKLPKDLEKMDQDRKKLFLEGCAPRPLEDEASDTEEEENGGEEMQDEVRKRKKSKKEKKKKKKRKKKKSKKSDSSDSDSDSEIETEKIKKEGKSEHSAAKRDVRSGEESAPRLSKINSISRTERVNDRTRSPTRKRKSRSRSRSRDRRKRSRSRDRNQRRW